MKLNRTHANRTLKQFERRQRRWAYPSGRTVLLAFVPFILMVVVLAGCNPFIVTARFADGSPKSSVEYAGFHVDQDPINAWDRTCALVSGCPFWAEPQDHYWHEHWYHDYIGAQGSGYWIHTWGGWHNFLNCGQLIPSSNPDCWNPQVAGVRG